MYQHNTFPTLAIFGINTYYLIWDLIFRTIFYQLRDNLIVVTILTGPAAGQLSHILMIPTD